MTPDHDIERVLDQWLTEGPTQMPSRFLDDTLDRIDRAPQPRLAHLRMRLPVMNPMLRFAAAAAVVLAVAGVGAAVLTRTADIGNAPFRPGPLPAALQSSGWWRSVGPRVVPGPGPGGINTYSLGILIEPTTIDIGNAHTDVINTATLVAPDRFEIRATTVGDFWHCHIGDLGTYRFDLTAGDQRLTLTPVADACAERAVVLAGDWVPDDDGDMSSDLPAGRYAFPLFRPFGGGVSGQFAFTVPSGWGETLEGASSFTLKTGDIASRGQPVGFGSSGILLLSNVGPRSLAADCTDLGAGVARTPAAMAAWLPTIPGLVATTPTPVTVGGLSGLMVDVSVDPGWQSLCPTGVTDMPLMTFGGLDPDGGQLQILPGSRARYILLDGGDGTALVVDIQASDEAAWATLLEDAMPTVQSFEFTR